MLSGSIPAVVTPFAADGSVAEDALRDHVERLIEHGSSAVVACGTTGEAPTLTAQEHTQVVRACVEQAAGRVPIVAGAGRGLPQDDLEALQQRWPRHPRTGGHPS